ncbi:MAG: hypothetical protein SPE37_05830, partial [Campylobacter sp.]|nr:hypothetical protein [Campylobacter sp.]
GDIAKKYPMLNKDEQIELANKQILANASAELLEYSKFLNGGKLPNDARLLGKNAGRMILKSLNAGASPAEVTNMLLKAGISGRNSTAAKALIQTGDINAYNAVMRQGEAELIAELSQNVRVAAKNESIGAILGSAKEKAIKNDELLKKGVGNQGLDDVTTTFKSSKSGKEFEVAENGFGRELLSYDGQVANEEMKRSFLAWEAQEKKADITLHDGRKVVFLEPDEAVQLSYGNSYLYGEKDLEALFARRRAESLEQKLKRLQSHPAYENLLKMRENTKASELKGDTVGGSKPTVFYEPQSERYLRTQGGGGLPNAERSITITKADVAKLRADKANEVLATKLENNLEALTGDPAASGLIDDLLTRDYHLASAAKKSELVAPKNADEVSGNSRTPSDEVAKVAENPQGNFEIASYKEKKEILAATPMEQWSKEQKEFFDDMPSFQKDEILEASKIKHDEEVFGKIPYNELSDRNKRKVIDEARFSAKGKELQAQYDRLQSAKYTAGAGGKYPSSQQLAKITKTQNKITAQRDELINAYIKEYDEKVARNSRTPSDEVAKVAENSRILDRIKALADNEPDEALAKKIKEFSPQEIIRHDPYDKEPITPETYGHYFSTLLFVNRHNYPNDIYKNPILHYELDRFNMELPRQGLSNGKYLNPDDLVRLDDILLYRTLGSEEKIKAYYSDPDLLISGRRKIERAYLVHPIKEFGTNYAEFYHAGGDAIKKLLAEKQGQVAGAFYDERFGDVGIVWGAEGTAKSDGWGIAKIAKYHPEALEKMEEMLKMPIIAQSENRIKLSDGKYFMSIRKDFNGEKQNWVLTAFEKEESKSASGRRTNLSATQSASEKTTSQNTHTANSSRDEIKSQEMAMRESFSPELKASYDMRDKLLKSTNEVRASLNEKGKAELEKLAGNKDSKLSRDAQIMKTLENAKSNPARYAKLKKLYLDENGKVKDSIGLC